MGQVATDTSRKEENMNYQMEKRMYDTDKFCWCMYMALRSAPKDKVRALWDMLSCEQQTLVKELRETDK